MINEIGLRNFKCFSDKKIKLNTLTILAGANASGKSSIIQALLLYFHSKENITANIIDVNNFLHIDIGSPKELLCQNPVGDAQTIDIIMKDAKENTETVKFKIQDPGLSLEVIDKKFNQDNHYFLQYLNAERIGPRIMNQILVTQNGVSANGENAAYIIEKSDREEFMVSDFMRDKEDKSKKFSYQVEKWMSAILGELQIDVQTDYQKSKTEIKYRNSYTDYEVVPPLTGFGISYVLPIVVAGLYCSGVETPSVLLVENPEAHLHPNAQSNIGKFLALIAQSGVQVILETHSDHVIDGARLQMIKGAKTNKMVINYFENLIGEVSVHEISVKENGDLTEWPKGFFDQKQTDLRELMKVKMKL